MLTNPERKIGDIAGVLGYTDPGHFTRAFRRWTGLTPREFRRRPRGPRLLSDPPVTIARGAPGRGTCCRELIGRHGADERPNAPAAVAAGRHDFRARGRARPFRSQVDPTQDFPSGASSPQKCVLKARPVMPDGPWLPLPP